MIVANFLTGIYHSLVGSLAQVWDGPIVGQLLDCVFTKVAATGAVNAEGFRETSDGLVHGSAYALSVFDRFTAMQDLLLPHSVHDVEDMGWPEAGPVRAA